ncbi:MAG TPA: hypothetical protein VNY80_07980 [Steroidobacteraceae bacterium]|nr:hypothetical protein [Steroidobacteraceae bacterium]
MTHTAGPWHADEHMRVVGANGDVICDVDPFDVLDAAQANLRLIAAAPDLRMALTAMLQLFGKPQQEEYIDGGVSYDLACRVVEQARAAIAKAEVT